MSGGRQRKLSLMCPGKSCYQKKGPNSPTIGSVYPIMHPYLLVERVAVVEVDVGVAEHVDEVARPQPAHLRHHPTTRPRLRGPPLGEA